MSNYFYNKSKTEKEMILKNISEKNPDKVPIIIEPDLKSKLNFLKNTRFVVPKGTKLIYFLNLIKAQVNMKEDISIFIYTENREILNPETTAFQMHKKYCNSDGFVYLKYSELNSFGSNN